MAHLKCGRPEGHTVWAPGLLGTVALHGLRAVREGASGGRAEEENRQQHQDAAGTTSEPM